MSFGIFQVASWIPFRLFWSQKMVFAKILVWCGADWCNFFIANILHGLQVDSILVKNKILKRITLISIRYCFFDPLKSGWSNQFSCDPKHEKTYSFISNLSPNGLFIDSRCMVDCPVVKQCANNTINSVFIYRNQ